MSDLNTLAETIGETNFRNGWHDRFHALVQAGDTAGRRDHVVSKLALITTEVAEAIEEIRDGQPLARAYYRDDGKPEGVPVELADILIRVLDLANMLAIDIDAIVTEKLAFNARRGRMHGGKTL